MFDTPQGKAFLVQLMGRHFSRYEAGKLLDSGLLDEEYDRNSDDFDATSRLYNEKRRSAKNPQYHTGSPTAREVEDFLTEKEAEWRRDQPTDF